MRLARALFRLALRAYPVELRSRFEAEAMEAFERGVSARRSPGRGPLAWYAAIVLADTVRAGMVARWRAIGVRWLAGDLGADIRLALRRLVRAPGLSLSIVGMLVLGVGVNAAVVGALRSSVLATPPFPDSERLVLARIVAERPGDRSLRAWSYPQLRAAWDSGAEMFDGMAAYAIRYAAVSEPGPAVSVPFEFVSMRYFGLLGARPALGRFFVPEEETAVLGVAILSHAMWHGRFGGDSAAVGATMVMDGARVRVIGVAPQGFRGLSGRASFWVPLGQAKASLGDWTLEAWNTPWLHALARLPDEVGLEAPRQRLESFVRALETTNPARSPDERIGAQLTPLAEIWTNAVTRRSLWLVTVGAALVLLVTVANVSGLLLTRARREARDRAIRKALGASRLRLARQVGVEALLLAASGALGGLLVAHGALRGMRALWPSRLLWAAAGDVQSVDPARLALDPAVALIGVGLAMAAAVAAAALAAFGAGAVDVAQALRRAPGGRAGGSQTDARGRAWLVGAQAALSATLLVGAGLLTTTLQQLQIEQRRFDSDGLLVLSYSLVGRPVTSSQESLRDFHTTLRARVATLPGVSRVALGSSPPLAGGFMPTEVRSVGGQPAYPEDHRPSIGVHLADGRLFETLGVPLVRGRGFTGAEERSAEPVLVLSRAAASALFPSGDAIGGRVDLGLSMAAGAGGWRVVGVVDDVLYGPTTEGPQLEAYIPLGVWAPPGHTLFVRVAGDPSALVPAARDILAELDPAVPFWRVLTGDDLRTLGLGDTRAIAYILIAFATLAVSLSAAGVWAVMAQTVVERRREFGVRIALGAGEGTVERLVLRGGLLPVAAGGLLGLGSAWLGARFLVDALFRTAPGDARIYTLAGAIILVVACAAAWIPARRAARVAPAEALAAD